MAAILYPICLEIAEGVERLSPEVNADRPVRRSADPEVTDAGDWWSGQERWSERRAHTLASAAQQPAWSATALSKAAADGRSAGSDARPGRPPSLEAGPGTDPETQRRIGRAVHDACSAKIELPSTGVLTDDAVGIAVTAARAQHLDDAGGDLVVALVRSAVGSPLLRSIASGRHWKELPLAAPLPAEDAEHGGGVIEGFADLVGETPAGLVVVDFKTAAGRSSSTQYLLAGGPLRIRAGRGDRAKGGPGGRHLPRRRRDRGGIARGGRTRRGDRRGPDGDPVSGSAQPTSLMPGSSLTPTVPFTMSRTGLAATGPSPSPSPSTNSGA